MRKKTLVKMKKCTYKKLKKKNKPKNINVTAFPIF